VNDVVWRIDDVGAILCREDTRVFEDSRREREREREVKVCRREERRGEE